MPEVARFEARRRLKGSVYLGIGVSAFALLFVSFYPSVDQIDVEAYAEAMPEAFSTFFSVEAMDTIEGFLAVELYQFVWVLALGLYAAYLGGGLIAGEADADRLDVLLSLPRSRPRLLAERLASLAPVLVLPNAIVPPVVYVGVLALGESISVVDLLAVHALSIPYLLACASIGAVVSVLLPDGDLASRAAVGAVFGLHLLETLAEVVEREWLGAISPTRYYDPTEILAHGDYGVVDPLVLTLASLGLLVVAGARFRVLDAP